eukprot:CAMPEP_0117067840 /NCGR_PEP_ID=MMETSP0472-20121206/47503_1 /TAXON_ID=693140 ORGANISM="Tiarina fusus, Strain LIS" /NCGR_SAMPLE_ID=MMETSP0472 /ASSEMBLY_ACC=CAM_ASM_000603 /LENGTH=67 /DNA_ID=CAMNT_0004789577 /DNA_START=491 /DNA_END=694 /DNA_ORIENTATION=+
MKQTTSTSNKSTSQWYAAINAFRNLCHLGKGGGNKMDDRSTEPDNGPEEGGDITTGSEGTSTSNGIT